MNPTVRWLRIGLVTFVLSLIVGLGLAIGLHHWKGKEPPARSAAAAYADGQQALQAGDVPAAALHFHEAILLGNKLADQVEAQRQQPVKSTQELDERRAVEGQVYLLKARALRDHAFAKALAEGKPLPQSQDAITHETYRDVTRIADDKAREDAITSLYHAAYRLPGMEDLQKEALRAVASQMPIQITLAEVFSRNIIKLDSKDVRALTFLARVDFDQPGAAPAKRSRQRILQARDYVNQLKQLEATPSWQTLYLEVQIHRWLAAAYNQSAQPAEADQEIRAMRTVLFEEPTGALPRAVRDPNIATLNVLDTASVLMLHLTAVERQLEELRKSSATTGTVSGQVTQSLTGAVADCTLSSVAPVGVLALSQKEINAVIAGGEWRVEPLLHDLDALLAVSRRIIFAPETSTDRIAQALNCAVIAAGQAQPFVARKKPSEWSGRVETLQSMGRKALAAHAITPLFAVGMADLLRKDAFVEGGRGKSGRRDELNKQAIQWVEDGLKAAEAQKRPAAQLVDLHAMAAEMKSAAGASRVELAPHLQALKASSVPQAQARALLLEGVFFQREGRLEKARKSLEQAAALLGGSASLRAHIILGNVCLALREPEAALKSLRAVANAYARLDQMSEDEKTWAREFLGDPADVTFLQIRAHLDAALLRVAQAGQQNASEALVRQQYRSHEAAAQQLVTRLPSRGRQELAARQMLCNLHLTIGQREQAEKDIGALRADYPDNVDVLRAQVTMMVLPRAPVKAGTPATPTVDPVVLEQADQVIERFIGQHASDVTARLFWVEWLVRTDRAARAIAYLENAANFAGLKNRAMFDRLYATALLRVGQQEKGMDVLRHLPQDSSTDAALIQLARSPKEMQERLAGAMARHESNGVFRCWNAGLAFKDRDFERAARGYFEAVEFSQVKGMARTGLMRSLFALAGQDPSQTRDLIQQMLKEYPGEQVLLLPLAYASLLLDDIGSAATSKGAPKDMLSALNAWEQSAQKEQPDPTTVPLTRAEFWILANRMDLAWTEVSRAMKRAPLHPNVWELAGQLALNSGDANIRAEVRKYLDVVKKQQPDSPQFLFLDAQLERREEHVAQAIQSFATLIDKHPTHAAAYANLVALLEEQGNRDEAAKWAQRWRAALPIDLQAVRAQVRQLAAAGQVAQARQVAEEFLQGRLKAAEERLTAQKTPQTDVKDFEKNKQAMIEGLRLTIEGGIAGAFLQARTWDEAETWTQRILAKQPDLAAAQLMLGDVYLGRLQATTSKEQRAVWAERSRQLYASMIAKQPAQVVAINNLGWLLVHECGKAEQALQIMQQVRKSRFTQKPLPGDRLSPDLLDTFGMIYRDLNRPELFAEMREMFESARQRYSQDPRMYLYLGYAYAGLGDRRQAEELMTSAVALAEPQGRTGLTADILRKVKDEAQTAINRIHSNVSVIPSTSH